MSTAPARVAIVGGGPTGTAFLERLLANVPDVIGTAPLEIHLVDPFPPGAGRVWRHAQSPLLWTNSMAEDVTMFTDESVRCEGPICPGPTLDEWAAAADPAELATPELAAEARTLTGMSFPTRQLQSAYLAFVYERILAAAPANVAIVVHATTATDLRDGPDGRQVLELAGEAPLVVDAVVLALGHLDVDLPDEHAADAAFARRHQLFHLAPAYTADLDLDAIAPGSTVIVRGAGLAFIDLMVLLTEGRGGRFVDEGDGRLRYEASGREPHLFVGSRRGVPYRSKIGYRLLAPRAPLPKFFDRAAVERLVAEHDRIEFRPDVWPLIVKDVGYGYYWELFHAHPDRVTMSWDEFAARYAELDWETPVREALVAEAVPADEDRFDVERLDRPLAGLHVDSLEALQAHLRAHVEGDRARRRDPAFSADLGAFYALLVCFGQLAQVIGSGKLAPRSLAKDVNGWWFGFFSYFASGPPGVRLDQLLALSRAGVVTFLGAGIRIGTDEERGVFTAASATVDDVVEGTALVEARLPASSLSRTRSLLLRSLRQRGEVVEHVLVDEDDSTVNTGKVRVGSDLRLVDATGGAHPRRFALGIHTSRPAAGTFARPRTNALSFRQNDAVARSLLTTLTANRPGAGDAGAPLADARSR